MQYYKSYLQGSARFLCPFGYRLVGKSVIRCGYDGRWNGEVPTCKGKWEPTAA